MNEETLFQEALSRSPEERAAFLDQACAGRRELRAAVEALLLAHEKSGNVLDKPPAELGRTVDSPAVDAPGPATGDHTSEPAKPPAGITDDRSTETSGAVIAGRYTLVEKIGEGGMGDVWVAKQTEPVKRKVALKLIKAGMDSRAVLQRFEQERQALAIMEHPNIARVIDGGMTAERRPFFVMELVNGLPLTKFCDEAKMGIRDRLELFASICQAVQHAHQKGIIHRDLKPSNILVTIIDGKPIPKVIDFGVAKATSGRLTDESLSTQFGAVVGTLEYMSPEQAGFSGEDIDTRADIYSLGVILYELLTGLRPIDARRLKKAAITEMLRIIKEEGPSKPSTRLSTDASAPSMAVLRHTEPRKLAALLARRVGLGGDEVPGEAARPALRDGQWPGPRHPALPGQRGGGGPSAERRLSGAEVREPAQRAGARGRTVMVRAPRRDRRDHPGPDPRGESERRTGQHECRPDPFPGRRASTI